MTDMNPRALRDHGVTMRSGPPIDPVSALPAEPATPAANPDAAGPMVKLDYRIDLPSEMDEAAVIEYVQGGWRQVVATLRAQADALEALFGEAP